MLHDNAILNEQMCRLLGYQNKWEWCEVMVMMMVMWFATCRLPTSILHNYVKTLS